jgi:hypothetical protein
MGTPASGPIASPAAMRASSAAAAARAPTASTVMKARTPGSAASNRPSHSSVTSTADRSPAWTWRAISRRAGVMGAGGEAAVGGAAAADAAAAVVVACRGVGANRRAGRDEAAPATTAATDRRLVKPVAWRPAPHRAPRMGSVLTVFCCCVACGKQRTNVVCTG